MNARNLSKLRHKQNGIVLMMLVFVLAIAGTATFLSYLDGSNVKIERDKQDAKILADAKAALIGYSIGVASDRRPGDMLIPDSFGSTENPRNYDGNSDSGCLDKSKLDGLPLINSDKNMRCLGRLPWKTLGMDIQSPSENDPTGMMPWYAVSGNLVDPTCLSILNSNILNLAYSPSSTLDCSGLNLPYPWLTVRDGSGNILSNRVAVIIFIPGLPRAGQLRMSSPNLGDVSNYLDSLIVPSNCSRPCIPGSYSNADMDNDYITAAETGRYAKDTNFNDKLIYITMDELMVLVERRAGWEARQALLKHFKNKNDFPTAASLGYINGTDCSSNLANPNSGFLPFIRELKCDGSKCLSDFGGTVTFTSDKNYQSSNGSCTYSSKKCTCTDAGSCARSSSPVRSFVCAKNRTCVSNVTGTFVYDFGTFNNLVTVGDCTLANGVGTCNSKGSVIQASSCENLDKTSLPDWFFDNEWKHFIYYAKGNLMVGARSANAVLVSTGVKLNDQNRPPADVNDYLENLNPPEYDGLTKFYGVGTPKTATYNDQIFIVSP